MEAREPVNRRRHSRNVWDAESAKSFRTSEHYLTATDDCPLTLTTAVCTARQWRIDRSKNRTQTAKQAGSRPGRPRSQSTRNVIVAPINPQSLTHNSLSSRADYEQSLQKRQFATVFACAANFLRVRSGENLQATVQNRFQKNVPHAHSRLKSSKRMSGGTVVVTNAVQFFLKPSESTKVGPKVHLVTK